MDKASSALHRNGFTRVEFKQSMSGRSRRYRCIIALILVSLSTANASAPQYPSSAEFQLFNAANQERKAQGLKQLRWDDKLAWAARGHAREMASRNVITHDFPGEAALPERVTQAGVRFSAIAENVAEAPSVATIHELWMHSPGHRANVLDKDMDSLGVGVVRRNREYFAVEDFARAK
jgi:uncharacterized protein YkwD